MVEGDVVVVVGAVVVVVVGAVVVVVGAVVVVLVDVVVVVGALFAISTFTVVGVNPTAKIGRFGLGGPPFTE